MLYALYVQGYGRSGVSKARFQAFADSAVVALAVWLDAKTADEYMHTLSNGYVVISIGSVDKRGRMSHAVEMLSVPLHTIPCNAVESSQSVFPEGLFIPKFKTAELKLVLKGRRRHPSVAVTAQITDGRTMQDLKVGKTSV